MQIITGVSFTDHNTGRSHRFEKVNASEYKIFERECIIEPEGYVGRFKFTDERKTEFFDEDGEFFESIDGTDHFDVLNFLRSI